MIARQAWILLPLLSVLPVATAEAGSSLAAWRSGTWSTWWRSEQAPTRWESSDPVVTSALRWQPLAQGLEWASLRMRCGPVPTRLVLVRLDPTRVHLSLEMARSASGRPAWTIDDAPDDALLAMNAGQFVGTMPWGWVVIDGVPQLSPGQGPLASALSVDATGRTRWTHGGLTPPATGVISAFQSYPTLLAGEGVVPAELQSGAAVSREHRDARLALGQTREGRWLIVMTRFDGVGELAGNLPLGPTTPEMAAILGALGARDAVMLDGGISAQLLLRGEHGPVLRWPGHRKEPLALIARARTETARR